MRYLLLCEDKPGGESLRLATRQAHLDYVATHRDLVVLAGPLLSDDGEGMLGSLFILEAEEPAQVERFHDQDPYTLAGLWQRVTRHPFRQVVPAP